MSAWRAVANAAIRLLVLGGIAMVIAWPYSPLGPNQPATPPTGYEVTPTPFPPSGNLFTLPDLTWLWIGLTAAAAGLFVVVLIRQRRRHGESAPTPSDDDNALAKAADAALSALMSEGDARRAILACYEKMERSLAKQGVPRRPEETAVEYARRLLLESGAPREPVLSLTTLFHIAGFSAHVISETMRTSAITSVSAISEAAS